MNTITKPLYPILFVCLALYLIAACAACSTTPPITDGEGSPYHLEINLLGTKKELSVDSQGRLETKAEISSDDGRISLSLEEGTIVPDKKGRLLKAIEVAIDSNPPPTPDNAYIVGEVYEFRPEGASFNPQIELTLSYDPEELLEGLTEEDVYIASYQNNKWEGFPNDNVDTKTHRVTTQMERFARVAILAPKEHPGPADKVEVVYFHRTQRCYSCRYVEAGTRYTVETYFKDELASGKLTLQVVDVQDKANADIVKKYGAYTSSLFINTIKDGTDYIEEAMDIYLLIGKDEAFVKALKSKIEKSLKGET